MGRPTRPTDSYAETPLACLKTTVDRYLRERRALGEINDNTRAAIRWTLNDLANHAGPTLAIRKLDRSMIEAWAVDQRTAASTLYTRLSDIRTFTRWCVEHQLLRTDPCIGLRGPRRPRSLPRAVDRELVGKLLLECDERLAVVVLLGAQEGLRRSEIARLNTSDIEHDRELGVDVLRVRGKGSKERWVPLSDETAEAIDMLLTASPAGPHQPIIRSYMRPTEGLTPHSVGSLIAEAMRRAGIKRAGFDGNSLHALRHTCANDMLDQGADIRDVQEMLGHDKLATTAVYARRRLALDRLRDAASGRRYVAQ